jgi:hypothetical protein
MGLREVLYSAWVEQREVRVREKEDEDEEEEEEAGLSYESGIDGLSDQFMVILDEQD